MKKQCEMVSELFVICVIIWFVNHINANPEVISPDAKELFTNTALLALFGVSILFGLSTKEEIVHQVEEAKEANHENMEIVSCAMFGMLLVLTGLVMETKYFALGSILVAVSWAVFLFLVYATYRISKLSSKGEKTAS